MDNIPLTGIIKYVEIVLIKPFNSFRRKSHLILSQIRDTECNIILHTTTHAIRE
jgi:hypothetical protein